MIAAGRVLVSGLRHGLAPPTQALLHAVRGGLPPATRPLLLLLL